MTKRLMCMLALLASLPGPWAGAASYETQPDMTRCSEMELRVAGLFKVGTAALYLHNCSAAREIVLDPVPKQFSLQMARDFAGTDLRKTARDALRDNLGIGSDEPLPESLRCLADAYVDARDGDRYDVIYRPRDSLELYLNRELVKRCEDTGQGEKYFMIWFGEDPFHQRLRDTLLDRAEARNR